jgi:hypothetical protein
MSSRIPNRDDPENADFLALSGRILVGKIRVSPGGQPGTVIKSDEIPKRGVGLGKKNQPLNR